MDRWVALLRGVNVGGGNKVPMAELRDLAAGMGWAQPQTYIASGNLLFRAAGDAPGLALALRGAMAQRLGVDVPVLVLPGDRLRVLLAACPFDPPDGRQVHGFVLWQAARIDTALYQALRAPGEDLVMGDGVVWLQATGGFGRSKLVEKLHKVIIGSDMTGRNLNTFRALAALLDPPE